MAIKKMTEKRECGHCGTCAPMIIAAEYVEKKEDFIPSVGMFDYGTIYQILLCQNCEKVELRSFAYDDACCFSEDNPPEYITLYPALISIPDGLPEGIESEYKAAIKARNSNSNAYGVLLGRVLEAVLHDKKAKGKMLGQQLDYMGKLKLLPPEIISIAKQLNKFRVLGAHFNAGNLTKKHIPVMEKLIRAILEYVYSAPHAIKQAEKEFKKMGIKSAAPKTNPPA